MAMGTAFSGGQATAVLGLKSIFDLCGYEPHAGQLPIHMSSARHRLAACGRRFGKSQANGHEVTAEALRAEALALYLESIGQRNEIWLVGPEYTDSEKEFRVLWNDCTRLGVPFDRPGSYNNVESGEMVLSLWGGRFLVRAKSAKYPSTLVGEGLTGVVMCEAAKLKQSVWTKYIRPTLADQRGWSLWGSTPEGKNWFYDLWRRGQDPEDLPWQSWRFPSWANDIVFPLGKDDPEIADMVADMSEAKAMQEIEASFTEFVGRVFKNWDEEIHVVDAVYNPKYPIFLAMDFGWTNPTVALALQIDVWDNVTVLGEYRVVHRDAEEIAEDLVNWPLAANAKMLFPDPASPEQAALISRKLGCPTNMDTGGEKKWRIEMMRKALKLQPEHLEDGHPEKLPKLVIDRSCTGLIYEMDTWRYPENPRSEVAPNPEEPMDKDDHGPEALGRFYRGHFGPPNQPMSKGRAVVRSSTISRRRRAA